MFGIRRPETDLKRWSKTASLSPQWDERAKIIAPWLPEGANVADIGCGRMAVEKLMRGGKYFPVDVVRRDHRTHVVDLNQASIPDDYFREVHYVTLLGALEYFKNPAALLQQLSRLGLWLVCTYQLADFTKADVRKQNGWFTSFTASQFASLLDQCGYRVVAARKHDNQGLYLARPPQPKFKAPPETPSPSLEAKKRLVLSGFFGRGNAGDEALLQVQYERLSPEFDIVISVEERGAYQGFWDWYPYNKCRIIHQAETAIFAQDDVVGLHVGGGDLPFGFNGAQVLAAASAGKPVCTTGIDVGKTFTLAAKSNPRLLKEYLSHFSVIAARSDASLRLLQEWAPQTTRGADWAYRLETDTHADSPKELTLLTLREFPVEGITPEYRKWISRLIGSLERRKRPWALLPFCPEDERFLDHLESTWGAPREVHWWNPRRIKQLIAQAGLVVSIGRLHPMIFAASVGARAVFVDLDALPGAKSIRKAQILCEETGVKYVPSLPEFCDWLARDEALPTVSFPSDYANHFEAMVGELTAVWAPAASQAAKAA